MRRIVLSIFVILLAACGGSEQGQEASPGAAAPASLPEPDPGAGATAYTNANIWDGTGAAVMPASWLLVRDGRVDSTGTGEVPVGADVVDLAGAWVVPGFINTHGHVSGLWAADGIDDEIERIRGSLGVYASYGVTTVNSLGDSADPAILEGSRAQRDDPSLNYARAYLAGDAVAGPGVAEARQTALANAALKVDSMKIRIDDNLGTQQKISWDAVQAAIDVARQNDIPVATHIFYMDDAAMVLGMGSNMIAHSVRDQTVSDTFVQTMLNSGVCYVPTLVREVSTFVYGKRPDFFADPFFFARRKTQRDGACYRSATHGKHREESFLRCIPQGTGPGAGQPAHPGWIGHTDCVRHGLRTGGPVPGLLRAHGIRTDGRGRADTARDSAQRDVRRRALSWT
jgi:hypothetical protein